MHIPVLCLDEAWSEILSPGSPSCRHSEAGIPQRNLGKRGEGMQARMYSLCAKRLGLKSKEQVNFANDTMSI